MKITIFGGGGFIGSAIVDRLLQDGHQLRVFERPRIPAYREFLPTEDVEWIHGDFLNRFDIEAAVSGADAVYHLVSATLPKSANDDPIFDVHNNLTATLQLLQACVLKGVSRLIFISSGGTVYGIPNYLPIDEHHRTEPYTSYGIVKLAIENYLRMFERLYGLTCFSLRVANPYGERQRVETAQGAVGVFLHKAMNSKTIEIWGDGSSTRDFLYVQDVAEAFARILNYDGLERVFNVSSGVGVSLNELIVLISDVLGRVPDVAYFPERRFDIRTNVLSNRRAQDELQWVPAVSMKEGLRRTVSWIVKSQR